jgi:VanZ family protein
MKAIFWRLAAVAWTGVIFFSSTATAGRWSQEVFQILAAFLFGQLQTGGAGLNLLYLLADKGFHVAMFTILAILLGRLIPDAPSKTPLILLTGAAVGSLSEVLQSFFPSRDPALRDVLINIAGTALGVMINFCVFRNPARENNPPAACEAVQP